MRREHYFAPDTVTQIQEGNKPLRPRLLMRVLLAVLAIVYLAWFWRAVFDWAARAVGGGL